MFRWVMAMLVASLVGQSAVAERFQLKSGEWLASSEYQIFSPFGEDQYLILNVEFEDGVDESLREQSVQEIVTDYLLPKAMQDGYTTAKLLESASTVSFLGLTISTDESWEFAWKERWQWEQTSGPEIDWSLFEQVNQEHPEAGVSYPSNYIARRFEGGEYYYETNAVLLQKKRPQEAMNLAAGLIVQFTRCNATEEEKPDYLADPNLLQVSVFVRPAAPRDMLDIVPNVSYTISPEDGTWTCDPVTMESEIEALGWDDFRNWREFIPQKP